MAATLCCVNRPTRRQTETSSHSSDSTCQSSLIFYGYAPVAKCFYSVPLAVFENDGLRDCRSYQAERFGCPVRQSKPGSNCSISRAQNNVICVRFRGPCINGLIISCSHSMVSRRARACSCAINVAYCASTGRATSRSQTLRPSR